MKCLLEQYVNVNVIAFITRHKVNIVDTEVQMVFLGGHPTKYYSKVIIYQLTLQTLQAGHSKFHNVTQTILSPSVPETRENKSHKYRRNWGANP